MSFRRLVPAVAALAGLLVAGSVTAASGTPFKIASTLDGKRVLPHRLHWLGLPTLPPAKIKEVDFLIDGKIAWVEHQAPYVYSEDDGPHRGYLVTSFLAPGNHRFVVRAIAIDGRKATDSVVARVLPAPAPPGALAGTWRRNVPDVSAAPMNGTAGNPTDTITPVGTYTMVIDKRWIQVRFPGPFHRPQSDNTGEGWIFDSDYAAGPTSFQVYGAVTFDTFHEQAETGWWCYSDGPAATYTWSVKGNTLTLTPVGGHDACGIRGFIWAGDWTRG